MVPFSKATIHNFQEYSLVVSRSSCFTIAVDSKPNSCVWLDNWYASYCFAHHYVSVDTLKRRNYLSPKPVITDMLVSCRLQEFEMSEDKPSVIITTENQKLGSYLGDASCYLNCSNSDGNIKVFKTESKSTSQLEFSICIWTIQFYVLKRL